MTMFTSSSTMKNQQELSTTKTNFTKIKPNFDRPEPLQDVYIPKG